MAVGPDPRTPHLPLVIKRSRIWYMRRMMWVILSGSIAALAVTAVQDVIWGGAAYVAWIILGLILTRVRQHREIRSYSVLRNNKAFKIKGVNLMFNQAAGPAPEHWVGQATSIAAARTLMTTLEKAGYQSWLANYDPAAEAYIFHYMNPQNRPEEQLVNVLLHLPNTQRLPYALLYRNDGWPDWRRYTHSDGRSYWGRTVETPLAACMTANPGAIVIAMPTVFFGTNT
jgi:hypothetical protein